MKLAYNFPSLSIHEVSLPVLSILRNEILNCDAVEFELIAIPCLNHVMKVIQSYSPSNPLIYSSCKILVDLLTFSASQPSLFREISTSLVPNLLTTIINLVGDDFYPGWFLILEAVLQFYPGAAGHQAGKIEKAIFKNVDNCAGSIDLQLLSHCFVCLPFVGQMSKKEMRWLDFLNKSSASLAYSINYYFDKLGLNCDLEFYDERKFSFSTKSDDDQSEMDKVRKRFEFVIYCLSSALLNGSTSPLKFNFTKISRCFDAFLSINLCKLMLSSVSHEQENIQSNILSLQILFCRLIKIMYECVGSNLYVYNFQIMNVLIRQLNWTKSSIRKPHVEDSFSHYRSELYETMDSVIFNSSELCFDVIYFNRVVLLDHLLHDINIVYNAEGDSGRINLSNQSNTLLHQSGKHRKSVHSTSRKKFKPTHKSSVNLDANSSCLSSIKVNTVAHVTGNVMALRVLNKLITILFNNSSNFDNGSSKSTNNLWQQLTWKLESILATLSSSNLESIIPYSNKEVFIEFLKFLENYCILRLRNATCSISFSSIRCFLLNFAVHHYDVDIKFCAHNVLNNLDAKIGSWTPRLCHFQSGKILPCLSPDAMESFKTQSEEFDNKDGNKEMVIDRLHTTSHTEDNNGISLSEVDQDSIDTEFIRLPSSSELNKVQNQSEPKNLPLKSDIDVCIKRCAANLLTDSCDSSLPTSKKSRTETVNFTESGHVSASNGQICSQLSPVDEIQPTSVHLNDSKVCKDNTTTGLSVSDMLQSFVHTFE